MNLSSLEEAVAAFELDEVLFYESRALRRDDYADPPEGGRGAIDVRADSRYRTATDRAEYRIKVMVTGDFGAITVDASIQYLTVEPFTTAPEVVQEFGTSVAAPALFPFLYEAVMAAGNRIGVEVKLKPFKPGDVPFK